MSLTSLPDSAGVGRSHYWEVLAGRSSPTLNWLGMVAEALEVPVERLLAKNPPLRLDKRFVVRGSGKQETSVPLYAIEDVATSKQPEIAGRVGVRSEHTDAAKLFVARVRGRSLEPNIPAGAYCLFRLGNLPKAEGKIALVELHEEKDPELKAGYTVKRVKKQGPKSITLTSEKGGAMTVASSKTRFVAELLEVLDEVKITK